MIKKTKKFSVSGNIFTPTGISRTEQKLPNGIYSVKSSMHVPVYFERMTFDSDEVLDLPSEEFKTVVGDMELFLKPEIRELYSKFKYLYKRSCLLHGLPGTGKSTIVYRLSHLVKEQGIVLFCDDGPNSMITALTLLKETQPESLVLCIMEEFDQMIKEYGEESYLSILDGETQRNNTMMLITTNHLNRVPKRLLRPGRVSTVVEVHYPSKYARIVYLEHKLGKGHKDIKDISEQTAGLSIDELKEVLISCHILGKSLLETVKRIKATRGSNE